MNLLPAARHLLADLQRISSETSYEQKGILFSEMLFFGACLEGKKPARIIESGRARGQSTHVLSLMFPDTEIASIEYDSHSPDCPIAAQRLAPFKNVKLLFGDSTRLIPEMLCEGDVVLIDGPKHFRAVRLALQLMSTGKPAAVFIHDVDRSVPERHYLDKSVPGVLYSDEESFVKEFSSLDDKCWPVGGAHDTALVCARAAK
jgi:predicted O-methyltransferase YrrM